MENKIIVTMAILTVASAVTEKVLNGTGKNDAAQILNVATISGLSAIGLTVFAKFIKVLSSLG